MAFDPNKRGGATPGFMKYVSPDTRLQGKNLRSPDQAAHEAQADRQQERNCANNANPCDYGMNRSIAEPYDWEAERRKERAMALGKHSGRKGGSTSSHENMLYRD